MAAPTLGGCFERHTFARTAEFEGERLERYQVQTVRRRPDVEFIEAKYVSPDEHPSIANVRLTGYYGKRMSSYALKNILIHSLQEIDEDFTVLELETGDRTRYQTCAFFTDSVGQPLIALDVVEGLRSQAALATRVVRKLDNNDPRQRSIARCQQARAAFGSLWITHRTLFSQYRQEQLKPTLTSDT